MLASDGWPMTLAAALAHGGPLSAVVVLCAGAWHFGRSYEGKQLRRRLAADLHDDIGASLSQLAIIAELISSRPGADPALTEIASTARDTLASLSELQSSVDPRPERWLDLPASMYHFASQVFSAKGITLHFQSSLVDTNLDRESRRHLFLLFKESVNNAAKHSGAHTVKVVLDSGARKITLAIEDDGVGFDPGTEYGGFGLRNMSTRARMIGAGFELESARGRGTVIRVTIPNARARRRLFAATSQRRVRVLSSEV